MERTNAAKMQGKGHFLDLSINTTELSQIAFTNSEGISGDAGWGREREDGEEEGKNV
jgi:hypothetical protein